MSNIESLRSLMAICSEFLRLKIILNSNSSSKKIVCIKRNSPLKEIRGSKLFPQMIKTDSFTKTFECKIIYYLFTLYYVYESTQKLK